MLKSLKSRLKTFLFTGLFGPLMYQYVLMSLILYLSLVVQCGF